MTRTPEDNVAIMQRAFAALQHRDIDGCMSFIAPDFIINIAGVPQMRGAETWKEGTNVLFAAFPDIGIQIEDIFATEDKVALRVRFTGTHTGEFQGIAATGNPIDYRSNEIYRIDNGRIAEEWICSDVLSLMTQIGAIPSFIGPPT